MARNDSERIEVDRMFVAELMDLSRRAAKQLEFADMALSEALVWAANGTESSLMQDA